MPGGNHKVRAFSYHWPLSLGQRFTRYIDNPFWIGVFLELPLGEALGLLAPFPHLLAWGAWGSSTNSLEVNADCLGRGTGCLGISALCLSGNSTISLGVSVIANYLCATCLWGATLSPWEMVLAALTSVLSAWELPAWQALAASELALSNWGGTCLRGDSTISLGVSADCLETNCLWVDSSISLADSADCLGTTCLRGRGTGCLKTSALCPGIACLCWG